MMSTYPEPFTVVMIEDDEGHARLIKKNLERTFIGNRVVHLNDGAEAMEYFFPAQPVAKNDKLLVLLDLNLPKVDGYEVLKRMKEEQATRRIPIIVMTTTDNPKEVDRCYELGCNMYITKPIEYDNFSDMMHKLELTLAMLKLPHRLQK